MSFRARLLLVSSATLALGIGTLLVFANLLLATQVRHEASGVLEARAQAQIAALNVVGGQVHERGAPNEARLDRTAWLFVGGRLLERPPDASPALTAAAVALARRGAVAESDAVGHMRLRADPIVVPHTHRQVGTVVVAYSVAPLRVLQTQVLLGSVVFAALTVLASALVIGRAIRRALAPVTMMTAEAEDWGAHDLERRFDLGPVRDELTALGAVLDGLLSRIAASRHHEQRFAADVAHELRTPVAAIRGWAELGLTAPRDGHDEVAGALEAIMGQADRLEATVSTLLEVARRELDAGAGIAELGPLLAELEGVEVELPPGVPPVEGDPAVVRQLLAPLIENARRHALHTVRVQVNTAPQTVRIAVRDDGPGVAAELGDSIFEPGVRGGGGSGAGLGLALARRLARACGGDIGLGPGPGGHFVVVLSAVGRPEAGRSGTPAMTVPSQSG
jgi:signal transduction histidine kinase